MRNASALPPLPEAHRRRAHLGCGQHLGPRGRDLGESAILRALTPLDSGFSTGFKLFGKISGSNVTYILEEDALRTP